MRAIASVTLSFGLVSIPVKLYSATEASTAIRFKLMSGGGARVRQQYVADPTPVVHEDAEPDHTEAEPPKATRAPTAAGPRLSAAARRGSSPPQLALLSPTALAGRSGIAGTAKGRPPAHPPAASDDDPPDHEDDDRYGANVAGEEAGDPRPADAAAQPPSVSAPFEPPSPIERHEMARGYEFEKGRFVLFTPAELKALQEASRDSIDIVAFIPEAAVDPIYYDKAYLIAPDKRGEKTYALLLEALRTSGRTALARWAWKGKEYVVQVRPAEGGLVLQQLLYADEVRLPAMLGLQLPPVGRPELELALKLIEQGAQEAYDPTQFVDEEKQRVLAAVERKIAGGSVISHRTPEASRPSGKVIDLLEALRASLHPPPPQVARKARPRARTKVSSRS